LFISTGNLGTRAIRKSPVNIKLYNCYNNYIIKHLLFFFFLSTTNGSESFHRTYNAQFHSSHPSVHVVISILKETQEETCTKIQSVFKGRIKKMENSDLNKEAMKEYNKYKIHKNIITYLSKICYISGTKV